MATAELRRVAFLVDCLYGDAGGGSERQFLQVYGECASIGVNPYVVFLRDAEVHRTLHWGRPPLVLGLDSFRTWGLFPAVSRLLHFLREERIEVVHTWFDDAALLGAMIKRLMPKLVLVASQRNIGHAQRWPRSVFIGKALRTADCVAVNAGIIRDFVVGTYRVATDRVLVIPNLYEARTCASAEAEALIRELRSRHDVLVVTVANLRPVKGIEDLLRAAELAATDRRIGYVIIGSGDQMGRYSALIRDLGLVDCVYLLGYRSDIECFLRHADIGVLPSRSEGLSNALIEYMFADLPVVATDVGGNREALEDGASGRLVPPGVPAVLAQAIVALASDPEAARALGKQAGISARRRYARSAILDGYRTLYRDSMAGGFSVGTDARVSRPG